MKTMTPSSDQPATDYRFYEVRITIAIPDYGIEDEEIDVTSYVTVKPDCIWLGYNEKPLTLNY